MLWTRCAVLFTLAGLLSREGISRQTPAQTFTIAGIIIEAGSKRPLKNAVVSVTPVGQEQGFNASCRTGEDGRFVFTQIKAGKYNLSARVPGFSLQQFGENEGYSTAIVAGAGLDSENVVFPLFAGGSIAGTVLDEEADPVRQAQVWLFRKGVFSGKPEILPQNQKTTDSSGQFRFPYLRAGTYFIAVQGHPWYSQTFQPTGRGQAVQTNANSELDVTYPLTYYAEATDPAAASAVTVTEGNGTNIQMTLRPVPSVRLQIFGTDSGSANGFFPSFSQLSFSGSPLSSYIGLQSSCGDNACQISGISPGRYLVSVAEMGQGRLQQSLARVLDLTADSTIDISSSNPNSLAGSIDFEGIKAPPSQTSLSLVRSDTNQGAVTMSAAADGVLRITSGNLLPGRYQLNLLNAPGYYLKSVAAKGATVLAGEIEIPDSASIQLSLIAAKGTTSIDGTALKDDKPFAGAMVLLIPKDFTRTDFIRRDQSDSDGTFTLADVPPGQYILLAIDDGGELAYCDAAAMKPYLSAGKLITVPVTAGSAVAVNVQHRQRDAN